MIMTVYVTKLVNRREKESEMKQYVKIGIEFKDEFDVDFCIFMKFLETSRIKDYNNGKLQIFMKTNAWEI